MKVRLGIFLLVSFVVLHYSCDKNIITSEKNNNEQLIEQESTDNSKDNEDRLFFDDSGELPRSYGTLLYKYDGYWSVRHGEYFRLNNKYKDVEIPIPYFDYITHENKDMLESKYHESIFKVLQSIFTEDRIRDLEVTIELDDTKLEGTDYEIPIGSNAYRIIVSVNIDGTYQFNYDEKHRFIILPDDSRERIYTPITLDDRKYTKTIIRNIIGYISNGNDLIFVHNIRFDRTKQFIAEDAAYFRQQKIITILSFLLVSLTIIVSVFSSILSINKNIIQNRRY